MNRISQFLLCGVIAASLNLSQAEDWPQYRGPHHNGHSSEKHFSKHLGGNPAFLWKTSAYPLGFASITTHGNRAFTVCARDGYEVAVAIDADTGREIWAHPMTPADYGHSGGNSGARGNQGGDGPRSTPSISDGKVYVMSADLVLYALDESNGALVWKKDLIKEHAGRNIKWKNAASPLVEGDLIFVAGGGPGQAMMAINKHNGNVVWKGGDDLMTHSTPTLATIHGVRQVIFFTQKGLVARNAKTGAELWRYPFKFAVSTAISPVTAGHLVYCSAGYGVGSALVRIERTPEGMTARELWRIHGHKDVANHWSTPVYHDGHLYGMFSFKKYGTGPLKCVELATGKVQWSKEGFGPGNCIIADGHIIALSDDGHLVIVKARSDRYEEVSRAKVLKGKCWTTPILSNGRIYVRSTAEAACIDVSGKTASR